MEASYEEQIKKLKEAHNNAIAALQRDYEERIAKEREKYDQLIKEVCYFSMYLMTFLACFLNEAEIACEAKILLKFLLRLENRPKEPLNNGSNMANS